jgi:DNA-binding response OmpR family regulator
MNPGPTSEFKEVLNKPKILLVDSDSAGRSQLAQQLRLSFATVEEATSAADALERIEHSSFDLILLEVNLSDMDGRELCRVLRRRHFAAPIVFFSVVDSDVNMILGLDAGASDYVAKHVALGVLLARLRAHLRLFERLQDAVLPIGRFFFLANRRTLTSIEDGRTIILTANEAALLKYLYMNSHRTITPNDALRDVWGHRPGIASHTVGTHVGCLRQKIERDASHPEIIVTTPTGYRLVLGGQAGLRGSASSGGSKSAATSLLVAVPASTSAEPKLPNPSTCLALHSSLFGETSPISE